MYIIYFSMLFLMRCALFFDVLFFDVMRVVFGFCCIVFFGVLCVVFGYFTVI